YETRLFVGNVLEEGGENRLGQTGRRLGSLVLAWDDVKRGAADPSDGTNLVLHEFAHQPDFEDNASDGAPALAARAEYLAWARLMRRMDRALCDVSRAVTLTVLDR